MQQAAPEESGADTDATGDTGGSGPAYCDFLGIPGTPMAVNTPTSAKRQRRSLSTAAGAVTPAPALDESGVDNEMVIEPATAGDMEATLEPIDEDDLSAVFACSRKRKTVRFSLPINGEPLALNITSVPYRGSTLKYVSVRCASQ